MPLQDDNVAWNRKRKFIAAADMLGLLETGGVITSLGAGGAVFGEISGAFELAGLLIGATGDELYHVRPIWWDMDTTQPMRFRVWFVHTTTDADAPVFKVFYKFFGKQAAMSDAASSPDETLTFGAHTVSTTDNSIEITDWKESVSETKIAVTDFGILLALECDSLGGAGADEMMLLGLEVQYTVRAMSNVNRQVTKNNPVSGSNVND